MNERAAKLDRRRRDEPATLPDELRLNVEASLVNSDNTVFSWCDDAIWIQCELDRPAGILE